MSLLCRYKYIKILFFLGYFSLANHPIHAQTSQLNSLPTQIDTTEFHELYVRFQKEVAKRYDLNLDSLRFYGHSAIKCAMKNHYEKGIIQIHLGLGSAYIDKYSIDSADHHFSVAINKATFSGDQYLLAEAYSGYGWTQVYQNSNYEGSIQNLSIACSIARELKDSSLINHLGGRLTRVLYLKGLKPDLIKAYKTCNELIEICKIRKDTIALVSNYYIFSSIFADMGLYDKQMEMVHQALHLAPHITDSLSLYRLHQTASEGYLKKEQYDSVLYYSRLNLPMARKLNRYPYCYTYIAKAFLETNQLDSARYYYEKILNEHIANGTYIDTYLYLDLGKIEYRSGNRLRAFAYLKKAESEITRPPLKTQKEIFYELHKYHKALNSHELALEYLEKYIMVSDSILKNKPAITLESYESAQLESEIQLLMKDKELQASLFAKKRQQEQVAYGSIAICFILIGLAFARFKKLKNLKAKQALINERLRISRDLHDEVGSTLSGIAMYTHVAKSQIEKEHHDLAQLSLSTMQNSANEMVAKLSDIVWLINPEQDSVAELLERVEQYAKQMAMARNMNVQIEIPDRMSKLRIPMEARRNIYLFCKESINNAVKYSQGSMIRIQVLATADHFKFLVADDGIGFDELIVKRGNGLKNMRQRAEEIGATFHIESHPDRGSEVFLQYKVIQ